MRLDGKTWTSIGVELICSHVRAYVAAERYAGKAKLPWPIPHFEGCQCVRCNPRAARAKADAAGFQFKGILARRAKVVSWHDELKERYKAGRHAVVLERKKVAGAKAAR